MGRSFEVVISFVDVVAAVVVVVVIAVAVARCAQGISSGKQQERWGRWESQTPRSKSPWGWHSCPVLGSIESRTDLRRVSMDSSKGIKQYY